MRVLRSRLALVSEEEARARGSGPADAASQIMGVINGLEMGSAFTHFSPANPEALVSDPEAGGFFCSEGPVLALRR